MWCWMGTNLNDQVKNVCKASLFLIHAVHHIHLSLTENMANVVTCALVQSRADYANSLYIGMLSVNFDKLQLVQNTLAYVITLSRKRDHIIINNNNAGVHLLHRLHQNEGEWVINTLWLEVAFTVYNERYWWWVTALYVLSAPCRHKCKILVLMNSQPPTSPPLTLHKALLPPINCRYQFTDPERMDSFVSYSTCVHT